MFSFFLVGSFGAGSISALFYPFDVMKTHLQMRQEFKRVPYRFTYQYQRWYLLTVISVFRDLRKDNNFRTLRMGILPMFFLSSGSSVMRISSYQIAYKTQMLSPEVNDVLQFRAIFFCGFWGSIQQVLSNPILLMKTKLQYWSMCESSSNKPIMDTITFWKVGKILHGIYGWRIFYRGWKACTYRGFIAATAQLVFYERGKYSLNHSEAEVTFNERTNEIIAAVLAGMGSTILVAPFDVILTRMHTQPYMLSMRGLYYTGWYDCMQKIMRFEGWHGLYRGGVFLWMRHGIIATLGILYWDVWKDDLGTQLATAVLPETFMNENYVQFCFDLMNLF